MHNLKLKRLTMAVVLGAFTATGAQAVPLDGGTLDPLSIPKYVTPLVIPPVMNTTGVDNDYDIGMRQFKQQILPGGIWNKVNGRTDNFPPTTVWSYGPATDPRPDSSTLGGDLNVAPAPNSQFNFPAYTIEATKDTNLKVDWINQLVKRADRCRAVGGNIGTERANDCKFLKHLLPIDQTLHWANPAAECDLGELRTDCHGQSQRPYKGPVPIVTHVHGAHTGPSSDGYTEGWWIPNASDVTCIGRDANGNPVKQPDTANGEYVCEGTVANLLTDRDGNLDANIANGTGTFEYLNDQPSTTLWYHDHALGMTRLNVYAGPAGFWLIRDPNGLNGETGMLGGNLPGPAPVAGEDLATTNFPAALNGSREKYREIPIVIQDRAFNADGSLWYPDNRAFFEGLNKKGTVANGTEQFPGVADELRIGFAGNDTQDGKSDIAPIWNPEAFFNTMVVNGTTWPQLEVAPSLYRFRLLNGTNSRFLNLSLPIIDPVTGLQKTVRKNIRFREIDSNTGTYKGPWKQDQARVNELYAYVIGTDQAMLPQVTAVRTGFATKLNANPTAWGLQQAPYMEVNNRLIVGETAQSTPEQALLMGPAERADVIVDFRGLPNGTVIRMINTAPDAPFGGFPDVPADPSTTGQVMQFVVNTALAGTSPSDEQWGAGEKGALLNPDTAATSPWDIALGPVEGNATPPAADVRDLVLIEEESALVCAKVDPVTGHTIQVNGDIPVNGACNDPAAVPFGPKAAVLGVTDNLGVDNITLWSDPIVNDPILSTSANRSSEIWNIKNITADAHPIHVHLVKYKVLGRTDLNGNPSPTVLTPGGLEAWEDGWKDTVIAYPGNTAAGPMGEITTIQAEFDIPGLYVWHCHIVEHEDNEMMVPFCVGADTDLATPGDPANPGVCPTKLF